MSTGSPGSEDYDKMAESEGGRLFFAGEATTCKYPATMHGAYISGLREAANISSTLERIQNTKAWEARGAAQKNTSTLSLEQKLATGQVLMKVSIVNWIVYEPCTCFLTTLVIIVLGLKMIVMDSWNTDHGGFLLGKILCKQSHNRLMLPSESL